MTKHMKRRAWLVVGYLAITWACIYSMSPANPSNSAAIAIYLIATLGFVASAIGGYAYFTGGFEERR